MGLEILIVGAGIGGLSAAIALQLKHPPSTVTVLEAGDSISEIGAGIQITPNFTRILYRFGLAERLAAVASKPQWMCQRRWQDGAILTAFRLGTDERVERLFGVPYYHMHRSDLLGVLFERAVELGVRVRTRCPVVGYEHDVRTGREKVRTEAGEVLEGDLVVAADGIRSRFSAIVLGEEVPSVPTGDSAYRGLLTKEQLRDPMFESLELNKYYNMWVGPGSHVVTYFVRRGELYNVVFIVQDETGEESWKAKGDMNKLRSRYQDWDPRLRRLLELIGESFVWRLRDRPALKRWLHPEGNVVLLGDAAHPVLPYVAQGAASACEDAAVLAECIGHVDPGQRQEGRELQQALRAALGVYQERRIPRAHMMREMARQNQKVFHFPDGLDQQARDAALKGESEGASSVFHFNDSRKIQMMWGHDVIAEANDHFRHRLPQSRDNANAPRGDDFQTLTRDRSKEDHRL